MTTTFQNLREVRERLVHMSQEFVSRRARIDVSRLDALERGELVPTVEELEHLASIYGVDADQLEDEPFQLSLGDGVACLARAPEYRDLGDAVRLKIIEAANAARDLSQLEQLLGHSKPRWERFKQEAPRLKAPRSLSTPPFRQGAHYAGQLRRECGLDTNPVASMLGFVREHFPSVVVLHANLGSRGPAGLAFVDGLRGPTIVLNLEGKNSNACVRRVSLAHELCHINVDWNRQEPLVTISGYLDDSTFEVEQRANAFAIRLLCPESVLAGLELDDRNALLQRLAVYGLPYAALRLYLKNQLNEDMGRNPSAKDLAILDYGRWMTAETDADLEHFPIAEVPPERRTEIARTAAEAFCRGLLTRSSFATYLGVSPLCEVERVVDHYGLDMPVESVA
ncbi:MAG: ImmA/IrrE family metallo-endopeptidase [Myxococcales bacterium]|nr:ImmA/IrrE family metallo-endopeptidase [Myxococcales bacterium]